MKSIIALLFVCCVHLTLTAHTWKWRDCADPRTRILNILKLDVSPKPLHIPGDATLTTVFDIAKQLPVDSHYNLNIKMDKKLLGHWHPVPCYHKFGTCLYNDLCEFLQGFARSHTCPTAGLPSTFPFNLVSLNAISVIPIKAISPQWQSLFTGDFRAKVEVLQKNVMIGCFEVELSIETPCTGFLCHGRK